MTRKGRYGQHEKIVPAPQNFPNAVIYRQVTPPRWLEKDLGNNTSTIFSNCILKILLNTKKI